MRQQRDRGRILTPEALSRLQQALRAWEVQHEKRCTQERIRELTSGFKEGGLDPTTISKILKAKGGVDPESIRCLFKAFGLQLEETDLVASAQATFQVDPNFVGREGAIADLNMLVNREVKLIVIQARGGVGKTTLARKFLQQEFGQVLEFPIAKETKDIASIESLIEEKLRQLGEEPGREFLVSIDRLKRKLQTERIGILIDNLEPALDSAGRLIEAHRRYVELLRVLADPSVRSTTLITSRERLHEPSVAVQHYPLRSLEVAAWDQFFRLRQLPADTPALAALHHAYGGNAKAMEILSSVIKQDYSEDIEAYWQENQNDLLIERDLEDLVTSQFNRLQAQDEDAYKLLCRIGCYRYQDVPTVPIEGLFCLLWDVHENRQKRVVRVLQERSMVDVKDGEYWLHPVGRGEAIGRLKGSDDWKVTSQKSAKFWTESVESVEIVEDVLQAFEAYYHYTEIDDYEQAGDVILQRRLNKWNRREPLGFAFYRLGLLNQMITAIEKIKGEINFGYKMGKLYNILSDLLGLIGDVHKALESNARCLEISNICIANLKDDVNVDQIKKLNWLKVDSLFHTGLCKIDLWEIEESIEIFEELYTTSQNIQQSRKNFFLINSSFRLAFLYSCVGLSQKAYEYLKKYSFRDDNWKSVAGGCIWIDQGKALSNLGQLGESFDMYCKALNLANEIQSPHVKAKAICGLAEIDRETKDFNSAIKKHQESINIFSRIGIVCNLAESYYQIGLTYQAMSEVEKSNENFQEAIRLFTEMEAPKQGERVRRSMRNNQ